jgi:hypothetical protein
MPANAPASMFAAREKLGGNASYLAHVSDGPLAVGRDCTVLVLFFDWNSRPIVGGHEPASCWRCGFQVGEESGAASIAGHAAVAVADIVVVRRARRSDDLRWCWINRSLSLRPSADVGSRHSVDQTEQSISCHYSAATERCRSRQRPLPTSMLSPARGPHPHAIHAAVALAPLGEAIFGV